MYCTVGTYALKEKNVMGRKKIQLLDLNIQNSSTRI